MPKKRKPKKGQLLSQPLVYIFAMIVGALILFFGFQMITNITGAACSTATKDWINGFSAEVEQNVFLDVGSQTTLDVRMPDKVRLLCIKSTDTVSQFPPGTSAEDMALINANTDRNVFILPFDACGGNINTAVQVDNLRGPAPLTCFPNGVKIALETVQGGVVVAKPIGS